MVGSSFRFIWMEGLGRLELQKVFFSHQPFVLLKKKYNRKLNLAVKLTDGREKKISQTSFPSTLH